VEDDELEVIRERMEETRSSLADKVDALENTILGTVESTTHSVAETVEAVKDKVEETVETVKETVKEAFNLRGHIERHPWLAMGVSVATGYVAGSWLLPSSPPEALPPPPAPIGEAPRVHQATNGSHGNGFAKEELEPQEEEPGPLQAGLEMIKSFALGSVMGLLRNLVTRSAPQGLAGDLTSLVDNFTDRIGGKRVWEGEEGESGSSTEKGAGNHAERESPEVGRPMGTARW
jgi:ElaB/YqjD/DUF883 family membrane-anchored ribosome-binding protein